jgi:hypothetical protein
MEKGAEKAYITFDPTEVTREALTTAILDEIEEWTDERPTVVSEQVNEDVLVLMIPEDTLAQIVEIRGVLEGRSEGVI